MYFNKLPAPLITILATFQAVGFLQAEELPARPNVLFIAIDDMNDWNFAEILYKIKNENRI